MSVTKEGFMVLGIIAAFAVVFPLFWCFVVWIISRIGGWATLAEYYAAGTTEPEGVRYYWRAMRISPVTNYNGCINVILSREGIYLRPAKIFSVAHKPLLLPWDCVEEASEHRFLGRHLWVSLAAGGKKITLVLPGDAGEVFRKFSHKQESAL